MANNQDFPSIPLAHQRDRELFDWVISRVDDGADDHSILKEYRKLHPDLKDLERNIAFIKFVLYYLYVTKYPKLTFHYYGFEADMMVVSQMSEGEKRDKINKYQDRLAKGKESESDDFEKLLDDFLENELNDYRSRFGGDDQVDDEEEEEEEEDDDDDYFDVTEEEEEIEGVSGLFIDRVSWGTSPSSSKRPAMFPVGAVMPFLTKDKYIHLRIRYEFFKFYSSYAITLNRTDCHLYTTQIIDGNQFSSDNDCTYVVFDGTLLFPFYDQISSNLKITIVNCVTGKAIYENDIRVYCGRSVFDFLTVNKFALLSTNPDEGPTELDPVKSLVKFSSNVRGITPICEITNLVGFRLNTICFQYFLYDSKGELLEGEVDADVINDCYLKADLGEGCSYKWPQGCYNLDLKFYDHLLATISFEVGEMNLEGEVDINTMVRVVTNQEQHRGGGDEDMGGLEELNSLIGLGKIKEKVSNFGNLIKLNKYRAQYGFKATTPSLHARFIGKPGTGKTTVASIIGKIYKELGLLSKGHVVYAKRSTLVGRYYDSELRAIEDAVNRAQGGVLFIDEAYTLYVEDDPRDPGKKVLEAIMTQLADPNKRDWMLVLAGYGPEMDKFIKSNDGLDSRVNDIFYFDDYSVDELMQISEYYCDKHNYIMTEDAKEHLRSVVTREYNSKDDTFANARYIHNLFEKVILVNMSKRINGLELPTKEELQTIEVSDMPSMRKINQESKGMIGLDKMVGLDTLKSSIYSHLNMVKLANLRMSAGIHTNMPPLHMIFTGNPGTGKTTVADFIGEIYASLGILSRGEVIRVEKKDLVGKYVGDTEVKMKAILSRAKGNILFIDEAYQLYDPSKKGDYGTNVMDSLLTTLANDNIDMIVILAGYADKMEEMISMNTGISSRFPYTFHFEDYSVEELYKIGLQRAKDEGYKFTPKAKEYLQAIIKREVLRKKSNFGNARFVTRLITTQIVPKMADRLLSEGKTLSAKQLCTITKADIPITAEEVANVLKGGFDEKAIDIALAQLDSLVGLGKAKKAIHDFVDIAKLLNSRGEKFVGNGVLKWSFVGNSGTGKSTVAAILADILKAMNLLEKGNIVEVKAEEIYNVSEYQCDQVLKQAMAKTGYGMLFIDGDAPELRRANGYHLTNEQLRMKLTSLKAETGNMGALVIAECSSPRQEIAHSLASNGIYDYDHIIFFDDYSTDELFGILGKQLAKHKVRFSPEAERIIKRYIGSLASNKDLSLANARTMKLLSRTIYKQVLLRKCERPETSDKVVLEEDVKNYVWNRTGKKIGY